MLLVWWRGSFALLLWNEEGFALQFFWGIGLFGLLLIILQAVFGLFAGHDGDAARAAAWMCMGVIGGGANYLSLKSISAMLLGLGFGGAILNKNGFSIGLSTLGGIAIGIVIGAVYIALMNSLYRLRSDGTAVLSDAVNRSGTVYMRIPAGMSASGEVQVSFGGRLQNIRAYTHGLELATGTAVRVVSASRRPCAGCRKTFVILIHRGEKHGMALSYRRRGSFGLHGVCQFSGPVQALSFGSCAGGLWAGGTGRSARCMHGGAAFIWPVIQDYQFWICARCRLISS